MQATKESPASHTLAGDKATNQLNTESIAASEDTTRLYHQTATATLMSALTAAPAHVVLNVAEALSGKPSSPTAATSRKQATLKPYPALKLSPQPCNAAATSTTRTQERSYLTR